MKGTLLYMVGIEGRATTSWKEGRKQFRIADFGLRIEKNRALYFSLNSKSLRHNLQPLKIAVKSAFRILQSAIEKAPI